MADDSKEAGDAGAEGGVFGNLPASRPGSRSPRRRSSATPAAGADKPERQEPAAAAPAPPPPPPPPDPEPDKRDSALPESSAPGGRPGVEDLAWAGVTVAAQAATVGVRFASRALDAARKSIDRP